MGNVRDINSKKYAISRARFREMYYHCLQYNEWRDELEYTPESAARREELIKKCRTVEETAFETAPDLCQYILKAVTNEGVTYTYLREIMKIPCGKDLYYACRRKFYWILSKKL